MTLVFYFSGSSAPAPLVSPTILSASLVLACFFRSFPALFVERFCGCLLSLMVLSCCFVSCSCLHFLGVPFGVLALPLFFVSSFPGFFLPSLSSSGCSLSLAVSGSLYFVGGSSVLLVLFRRWCFPLCVFLLFFPVVSDYRISGSLRDVVSLRVESGFAPPFCSSLLEFILVFLFLSLWFSCFPLTHSHLRFP